MTLKQKTEKNSNVLAREAENISVIQSSSHTVELIQKCLNVMFYRIWTLARKMTSVRFSKKVFVCWVSITIRVRVEVRARVSGNTFSVNHPFGHVSMIHSQGNVCIVTAFHVN